MSLMFQQKNLLNRLKTHGTASEVKYLEKVDGAEVERKTKLHSLYLVFRYDAVNGKRATLPFRIAVGTYFADSPLTTEELKRTRIYPSKSSVFTKALQNCNSNGYNHENLKSSIGEVMLRVNAAYKDDLEAGINTLVEIYTTYLKACEKAVGWPDPDDISYQIDTRTSTYYQILKQANYFFAFDLIAHQASPDTRSKINDLIAYQACYQSTNLSQYANTQHQRFKLARTDFTDLSDLVDDLIECVAPELRANPLQAIPSLFRPVLALSAIWEHDQKQPLRNQLKEQIKQQEEDKVIAECKLIRALYLDGATTEAYFHTDGDEDITADDTLAELGCTAEELGKRMDDYANAQAQDLLADIDKHCLLGEQDRQALQEAFMHGELSEELQNAIAQALKNSDPDEQLQE